MTERLLGHNNRIKDDIKQSDKVIEEIERSVLIKLGLMWVTIVVLGLAIVAIFFKKLFY